MKKFDHLIFDFSGVLFHWNPVRILASVLPQRADSPESADFWKDQFFQGYTGDWGAFDAGLADAATTARRIAERTGLTLAETTAVMGAIPIALTPMEDSVALLRRLRAAGNRLYFLSNMPEPYAEHLRREHDFIKLFDDGLFSWELRLAKPDPAIFRAALKRFELTADQAIFTDDHLANVEASNRLGLSALLFTDATRLERDLKSHGVRVD